MYFSSLSKQKFYGTIIILSLITFITFVPSLLNEFVNLDEHNYIHNNPTIRELSFTNIKRIFTSSVSRNYQPLTLLSFAVEYHFEQLNPSLYHITNLNLHICNTILVFLFVLLLSKRYFVAIVSAVLFGIHPLRVESVAWITERKDVLFCFFYLIALIQYLFYMKELRFKYLLGTGLMFFLALLSKPSAVTLPLILCLLDLYLGRRITLKVVLEKLPFFIFSVIFGVIAIVSTYAPTNDSFSIFETIDVIQQGFYRPPNEYTNFIFTEKLLLAGYAISFLLWKFVLPFGLSCFYPFPSKISVHLPLFVYIAPMILFGTIWCLLKKSSDKKVVYFGLFWFLLTVCLNLPLFNVGHTITADRFSYLPLLGIFIMLATLLEDFLSKHPDQKKLVVSLMVLLAVGLSTLSWYRCLVWKDSRTLWSNVIQQFPNEETAYFGRAAYFYQKGQLNLAINDYTKAIQLKPNHYKAYNNRGNALSLKKKYKLAFLDYTHAIRLNPYYLDAYINRASNFLDVGKYEQAKKDCEKVFSFDPRNKKAKQIYNIAVKEMRKITR